MTKSPSDFAVEAGESADSKARILAAASALFLNGGTGALSVRAIAREAGLSTMGIYSHFQGKQGILDALYAEGFARLAAVMADAAEQADPRAAALAGTQGYLRLASDYEAHYRLMFGERTGEYVPSAAAQAQSEIAFRGLVALVGRLMPAKTTRDRRLRGALQFWAQIHGYVSLKQQVLSNVPAMTDWQDQVLDAMTSLIDSMQS
jgi:AcrR family transcriptional regulator